MKLQIEAGSHLPDPDATVKLGGTSLGQVVNGLNLDMEVGEFTILNLETIFDDCAIEAEVQPRLGWLNDDQLELLEELVAHEKEMRELEV